MRRIFQTCICMALGGYMMLSSQSHACEIDLAHEFADITIVGPGPGALGTVATGDVNGDGFIDLILGGPTVDATGSGSFIGVVSVKFGPLEGGVFDLLDPYAELTILGEGQSCCLGDELATGDLDGDGIEDIVILAGRRGLPGQAVHIVFGSPDLAGSLALTESQANLTVRNVRAQDLAVMDLNGDGIDDLAAGAVVPGQPVGSVAVVFGGVELAGTIDLDLGLPDFVIIKPHPSSTPSFGSVLATGDVSGDGIDDLVVGDPDQAAEVVVVFGALGLAGIRDLRVQQPDFRLVGDIYGFGKSTQQLLKLLGDLGDDGMGSPLVFLNPLKNWCRGWDSNPDGLAARGF